MTGALTAVVRAAELTLAEAGVPSPRHDAEALAAHLLGVARSALAAQEDIDVPAYLALVGRRAQRVPLQHLTGRAGFRHLDLAVGPGVFVPRPETECLVEWALQALSGQDAPVVVDLCAGSGAIAFAIAQEHPGSVVHAVEREPSAFAWLERNGRDHPSVGLRLADLAEPWPDLEGTADLVVSNPPYVPDDERVVVEPEVRDFDPPAALWAGRDGLAVIGQVQRVARRLLRPGGRVAVEHSDRQGAAVPALLARAGWVDVVDHADLAGRPRFTTARRTP